MTAPTEPWFELLEQLGPLQDAVDGYRKDWERRGYSPAASEAMALDLHRQLVATIFRTVGRNGEA